MSRQEAQPDDCESLFNKALDYHRRHRLDDAIDLYKRLLAVRPQDGEVLHLLGTALYQAGRLADAERILSQALTISPSRVGHVYRGQVLRILGRFDEALAEFDSALLFTPDESGFYFDRATVLHELGRNEEAGASYRMALALDPAHAPSCLGMGNSLAARGRAEEASVWFAKALTLAPDCMEAYNNLGNALLDLGRFDAALSNFDAALARAPDQAPLLRNRGLALHRLGRRDEALLAYDSALAREPGYAEAHFNRACVLQEFGRYREALDAYGRAIELRPDFAEAHCNEGLLRLLMGDFAGGWEHFEWRWQDPQLHSHVRSFPKPQWSGNEELSGRAILLHSEQGLGDAIQFCRYATLVKALGAKVILEVPASLGALMSRLAGVDVLLVRGQPLPEFDYHCPLMSLPRACGTTLETVPAFAAYLSAQSEKVAAWESLLRNVDGPRVGLAWSGNPQHRNDENRSIPLHMILGRLPGKFVGLQKGINPPDRELMRESGRILETEDRLLDMDETAALIENLDLVISVDTSIAHLAGALGKPLWILLPNVPDWRWLLGRQDSPWYPSARLFRQPVSGGWCEVLDRVAGELSGCVNELGDRINLEKFRKP